MLFLSVLLSNAMFYVGRTLPVPFLFIDVRNPQLLLRTE